MFKKLIRWFKPYKILEFDNLHKANSKMLKLKSQGYKAIIFYEGKWILKYK